MKVYLIFLRQLRGNLVNEHSATYFLYSLGRLMKLFLGLQIIFQPKYDEMGLKTYNNITKIVSKVQNLRKRWTTRPRHKENIG